MFIEHPSFSHEIIQRNNFVMRCVKEKMYNVLHLDAETISKNEIIYYNFKNVSLIQNFIFRIDSKLVLLNLLFSLILESKSCD